MMATDKQRVVSGQVMDSVIALNTALRYARSEGLTVELRCLPNGEYQVQTIEAREVVLPLPRTIAPEPRKTGKDWMAC